VALGPVFSEYFGFPCQSSFHQLLHNHHHRSSGAGTNRPTVADVLSGISLTPPRETKLLIITNCTRKWQKLTNSGRYLCFSLYCNINFCQKHRLLFETVVPVFFQPYSLCIQWSHDARVSLKRHIVQKWINGK
jgi:hypothetical protein